MAYTVCRLSCLSLFSLLVKHKDRQRPRQKKKRGAFNGDEQIRPSGYSKSSDPSHFPASPPLVSALTVTSLQTNSSNLFAWRERERSCAGVAQSKHSEPAAQGALLSAWSSGFIDILKQAWPLWSKHCSSRAQTQTQIIQQKNCSSVSSSIV